MNKNGSSFKKEEPCHCHKINGHKLAVICLRTQHAEPAPADPVGLAVL